MALDGRSPEHGPEKSDGKPGDATKPPQVQRGAVDRGERREAGTRQSVPARRDVRIGQLLSRGRDRRLRLARVRSGHRLIWPKVPYEPGELKTVAYSNGKKIGEAVVRTAGEPATLKLVADRASIKADGMDLSYVMISMTDKGTHFRASHEQPHRHVESLTSVQSAQPERLAKYVQVVGRSEHVFRSLSLQCPGQAIGHGSNRERLKTVFAFGKGLCGGWAEGMGSRFQSGAEYSVEFDDKPAQKRRNVREVVRCDIRYLVCIRVPDTRFYDARTLELLA